ncbi:MAG TPA: aminotransferase class V-fold PLP-dependent enzyme [Terriglobales bacterium]|nr:aminotransferase class V-fold PLP-dependent enzyme [Terriglobales bacterium]
MTHALLHQVIDAIQRREERNATGPVFPRVTVEELRAALGGPLNEDGLDAVEVVRHLAEAADRGIVASAGPRYFGFVIGGSLPVTTAADWLTSIWDQNSGLYATSPAASVTEEIAAGWLVELLGLPASASVGFVTGGGTANFTGLAAARHAVLRKAGWDVEEAGLIGAPRINIVISDEAHATILAALRMVGLGTRAHRVPTDAQGRMVASDFEAVLAKCQGPAIVCAQAGNVNTGSFDPLAEIGEAVRARDKSHPTWLHVDGAFGLWAAVSERLRHLVRGVELADSWAIDGHKWLNVPYDSGFLICAHPEAHQAAMGITAAYLIHSEKQERDNFNWTPEFSRRARGFTVYAALRHLGRSGVRDLVERCCARARQFAKLLDGQPGVRVLNDVVLNQVLIRFHGSDEATRSAIEHVQRDGACWLSGTTWHKMAAMRISVSNWSTSEKDVEMSAAAILRAAAAVAPAGSAARG